MLSSTARGLEKPPTRPKESRNRLPSRKREARMPKIISKKAQKLRGVKAKIFNKQRFNEKVKIKKA